MKARIACALVLSLVLVACGGGSSEPAGGQALKADVSTFTGHGVYWNPAESGTGFFFEAQGGTGVITIYAYEADGRPVWYSAVGPFTDGGGARYSFTGTLQRFSGGQSATSTVPKTPTSTSMGTVAVVFEGNTAQVQVPGRSYTAEKFYKAGQGTANTAVQPETGIYWNPTESGRGFTIETNSNVATVALFHYADDGQPTWNLVVVPLTGGSAANVSGQLVATAGGQTLSGPYQAPTATVQGSFGLSFTAACSGSLTFPGMAATPVRRFAFGTLAAGAECRTTPPVVYIPGY
jgi:hypothetical protein